MEDVWTKKVLTSMVLENNVGKNVHVVPHGKDWAVKQERNPNPVSIHRTQHDAEKAGRPIAQVNQGELVIHRPDGRIRDSDSHGRDPYPPKG